MSDNGTYPTAIQKKLDELDLERERVLKLAPQAEALEKAIAEASLTDRLIAGMWIDDVVAAHLKIKDYQEVVTLLRVLARTGHRQSRNFSDLPSCRCRVFYLEGISIFATFPASDAPCRYVEVGKKKIPAVPEREEPILELRCDNVEPLPAHTEADLLGSEVQS